MPSGFNPKVRINDVGIENLQKALTEKLNAKVGVLGGKNARGDSTTNALVGAVHEFGQPDKNIPSRSFLRFPIEHEKDIITKSLLKRKQQIEKAIVAGSFEIAYKLLGIAGEGAVQRAFATGGFGQWMPLQPQTIRRKGNGTVLVDSAQLRNSISSEVSGSNG